MSTITVILEADDDGTIHLPLPPELRGATVEVTATLRPAARAPSAPTAAHATPAMIERRKDALAKLRELGGLKALIPDPLTWQRELRRDRSLPGLQ